MSENTQTNEQKLDEIYRILKEQQSAATRAKWFRLFKWIIILGGVYYISQNPGIILDAVTDIIMPTVMENMKTMMAEDPVNIMEQIKDIFPNQPK